MIYVYLLVFFKVLLLGAVVTLRWAAVASVTTTYLGSSDGYAAAALAFDARMAALCVLLVLCGLFALARRRWLGLAMQWLASVLLVLAALDTYIFQTTWQRLSWEGVATFGGEWSAVWDFFLKNLARPDVVAYSTVLLVGLLWLLLEPVLLWRLQAPRAPRSAWLSACLPALLALAFLPTGWLNLEALGTFKPLAVDVLTYQWAYSAPPKVSKKARSAFTEHYAAIHKTHTPQCMTGKDRRGNVVLVIMESLSAHHSWLTAQIHDWVPQIDSIFKSGWILPNFYANGFRTDLGLAAILTGTEPIAGDATGSSIYLNAPGTQALATRLQRHGYSTHFVSGSSLFFLDADQWLPSVGFANLHGPAPAPGETRGNYVFQAWSDRETYNVALKVMQQTPSPGLFVVNTMSSHMPYHHPETGARGEQAAMAYADEAFANFHHALLAQGFFDEGGILVLTGDHRSMTPISTPEQQRYGASAPARVPLFVLAKDLPRLPTAWRDTPWQHADLPASLEYWAGNQACLQHRQRNIFATSSEAPAKRCIIQTRGDNQRYVNAFCAEHVFEVELNAQGAKAKSDQPSRELQDAIDDLIARRLGLPTR